MESNNQELKISNEFATITVRKVFTGNGQRLEIESSRDNLSIRLDALQLESLTWQNADLFSILLAHSFEAVTDAVNMKEK